MICDSCNALVNRWLDYQVRYRGYIDYRATAQGRTDRAVDNYRMRAEEHWGLVRSQINAIRRDCKHLVSETTTDRRGET